MELTLNCSSACAWISVSSRRHSSLSSLPSSLRNSQIDADAGVFHPGEHAHQRELDPLVEVAQLACAERLFERSRRAGAAARRDVACLRRRRRRRDRACLLPGRARCSSMREVTPGEVFERVLPLARVEQVRHERGVVLAASEGRRANRASSSFARCATTVGSPSASELLDLFARLRFAQQLRVDVAHSRIVANASATQVTAPGHARPARLDRDALRCVRGLQRRQRSFAVACDGTLDLEAPPSRPARRACSYRRGLRGCGAGACGTRAG